MTEWRGKNKAETEFVNMAVKNGWEVTKRGWPDFVCYKGRQLVLVEVKKAKTSHLKRQQYRLMQALSKRGIECYKWTPDIGMVPVSPAKDIKEL